MAGDRFNTGKLKWSLVSWRALAPMVQVLMFGASKYGKIVVPLLEEKLKLWNVKVVTKKEPLELKNYVGVATSNNCLIAIQSIRQTGLSTKKSTDLEMLKNLKNITKFEELVGQMTLNTSRKEEMHTILRSTELLQMNLTKGKLNLANFVEEKVPLCTQIITMKLESLEVCFAVSAITGLDSSMITLNCLERLLNTSLKSNDFIEEGNNNWKKGLKYTEVTESLQRHLNSFIDGENDDPESKLSHVGHILCNAMFLSYMSLFRKDMDDRYIDKNLNNE